MKDRLRWFVHDIIVAVVWTAIFVGYYFTKSCDFVGKMLLGGRYGK